MLLNFEDIEFYTKLDFVKIEFQNRDTDLNSSKIGTYYYYFCKIRAKAQYPPNLDPIPLLFFFFFLLLNYLGPIFHFLFLFFLWIMDQICWF